MNEPHKNIESDALMSTLEGWLRNLIREEVQSAQGQNEHGNEDRLLDVEEACKLLCVDEGWLYRHHKKLPFARKLGPKMLRFSYRGIQKYLATRKNA